MHGALRMLAVLCGLTLITGFAWAQHHDADSGNGGGPAAAMKQPTAKVEVVEDTLHGVKIADPYRWLENGDAPDTQQFVRDELAYTRSVLDRLPGREQIHARLTQLLEIGTIGTPQVGGRWYFHTERRGTQNQPVLYVREGIDGQDRVLLDVNQLAADGTVALDWWHIPHDGRYVAYGISANGNEMSTLHILDTATGKALPDTIERTRAASIAWLPDASGFYYSRYPKKGKVAAGQEMYNRHVFFHKLGTDPAQDALVFGEGRDAQEWPNVTLSDDGRWLTIMAEQGWAKSELFLKDVKANTPPVAVTAGKTFLYTGTVYKGELYILTNEDAPRFRLFRVSAEHPERANWKEIVPQSSDARGAVLKDFHIVGGTLIVSAEHNAYSELHAFDMDGKHIAQIALPGIGTVTGVGGEYDSKELFYGYTSFTTPAQIMTVPVPAFKVPGLLSSKGSELARAVAKNIDIKANLWAEVKAPGIDPAAYQVEQVFYPSKDGTKVPMFVISKKGIAKDGHSPALLNGYGGFNISLTPAFSRSVFLWLEHGGIYAVANLRGGAEYGEDWHRAGMLANKQNVFDDFIAAGEYLVREKYTDNNHLAIIGGSNGGLLTGAALTQRPDLFKAVVCQVPLLDMLRYQNFQIAKLWIPEYGSSEDPQQFKWLYAYSPYHHVKAKTLYPATLFMTADSDSRVDPMHAKKMAARLQAEAANGPDRPILLRIEPKAGHGAGKPVSKQIEESTDVYSFLFWQLGMK